MQNITITTGPAPAWDTTLVSIENGDALNTANHEAQTQDIADRLGHLKETKADLASPALTGTATAVNLTVSGTTDLNGATTLDGAITASGAGAWSATQTHTGQIVMSGASGQIVPRPSTALDNTLTSAQLVNASSDSWHVQSAAVDIIVEVTASPSPADGSVIYVNAYNVQNGRTVIIKRPASVSAGASYATVTGTGGGGGGGLMLKWISGGWKIHGAWNGLADITFNMP